MTEEELRHQSIMVAKDLETHGDVGVLLKNADFIYDYLNRPAPRPEPPAKPITTIKSDSDAVIFIEDRLTLQHPVKGIIPFKLYEYQKKLVDYLDSKYVIINSARQMGVTHTLMAHVIYEAMTKPNTTTLWLTDTFNHTMYVFEELHRMTAGMSLTERNKANVTFSNGSRIIGRAVTADAARGLCLNRVIIDDAAFISHKKLNDCWMSIQPAIASSGKVVLASTPNTADGLFYKTWMFGGHYWRKIMLPWYEHPERDEKWPQPYINAAPKTFGRDFCCDFVLDAIDE